MKCYVYQVIIVTLFITQVGCSGSSGTPKQTNKAPISSAGSDQTVDEQTNVLMTGSGSDSDGSISSFLWSQTSGETVNLSSTTESSTSFIAPITTVQLTLGFELKVTDDGGATNADSISITVLPVNTAPTANANQDISVAEFANVSLLGSGLDNDGTIDSYQWTQTSGITATVPDPNSETLNFTAPEVTTDSILTFELTVTDNEGATHSDSVEITVTNRTSFLWSENVAWGGTLPSEGDSVTVPEGITITLDMSPPALAGLTIEGELDFDRQDLSFTSDWILVKGTLRIGSEDEPFTHRAEITLTGEPSQDIMEMGSRGLFVMGGTLDLHGDAPQTTWTQISEHIEAGATQISVLESEGWKAGDQIVLAPTDFYEVGATEKLTIASVDGNELTVTQPIQNFRWGLVQYITNDGMSLTPDDTFVPPAPVSEGHTPTELDERAEIGNLSRNIVIQSVDDSFWQTNGYGAQVMITGLDSSVHVDSVELRRAGQAGLLGRYPFHWHRLSYPDGINEIGDVNGHYIQNSTIHNSANRCVTIHATNGIRFQNNICFNVLGHGIFFEDAVERRNVIEDNLVLGVRQPTEENTLLKHERHTSDIISGSSGMWVTNPDNIVRNNVFADSEGFGLWMAFPAEPQGESKEVSIEPFHIRLGDFDNNTMHSNKGRGVMLDNPPVDDDGNVFSLEYAADADGVDPNCPTAGKNEVKIKGWKLWKNAVGNFWNRAICPTYLEFVSADSEGKYFAGAGNKGKISRALIVGTSLNNASPQPHDWIGPPTALATYHSTFAITQNIIANFPQVDGKTSGAFATDDFYVRPVEKGMIENSGNLFINSDGGHRSDAKIDEDIVANFAQGFTHFVFAGAVWDEEGIWGTPQSWNVYDTPFYTHDASCTDAVPAGQQVVNCDGLYFGVRSFILDKANNPFLPLMKIDVDRLDNASPDTVVGSWTVDGEELGETLLLNMRHFAARENGIYQLDFPESTVPTDVSVDISNMQEDTDSFVLAVRFSGSQSARVYTSTLFYPGYLEDSHANSSGTSEKHNYVELSSRQAVIDSPNEVYWQDTANNLVWIKIVLNGLEQSTSVGEVTVYNQFHLRIW
jgi:hypothetical protein